MEYKEGLHLVPSNTMLADTYQKLIQAIAGEWILSKALEPVKESYDYILIDCAPSLGIDMINALTVANDVLIPTTPEKFSQKGTVQLLRTIFYIKQQLNRELSIAGILFNRADQRTSLPREYMKTMKDAWKNDIRIFDTVIPAAICVDRSQKHGKSVLDYDAQSKPAIAYMKFIEEYLQF